MSLLCHESRKGSIRSIADDDGDEWPPEMVLPVSGSSLFTVEWSWRNKKSIPEMAVSWVEMGGVKHIFEHLKLR
jgi:hypothetical protein